jgi:transposase InsO family protein
VRLVKESHSKGGLEVHLHANAVLTVRQRQRLCDLVAAGVTVAAAAVIVGCSRQTASKWVNRGRRGESMLDRSSRPRHSPNRTPVAVEEAILRTREVLREGPHVIGWALGIAASTVHAVLRRHGRSRLVTRPAAEEVIRYEYAEPGGLVHVDIKKLGRILKPGHRVTGDRRGQAKGKAGWQYLFVAIDDHSRLGYAAVYPNETSDSSTAFLDELVRFYNGHGITVERVLTDNGSCFKRRWADVCNAHGIKVKKTRPYRPQTNGKAERFIRTMLERWAYAYSYANESERLQALAPALDFYNRFRPHRALNGLTPLQRVNNVPGTNT